MAGVTVLAAWGQWPLALIDSAASVAIAFTGVFVIGVIAGLLLSHELALYAQVRRRGGMLDAVGLSATAAARVPEDWFDEAA